MITSDWELIQACRKADERAWAQIMDSYGRLVFSIPLKYGLNHADAADVSQLTFTIFLQSLDDLRQDSHLSAWLAAVARRHSWRVLERHRRERLMDDDENGAAGNDWLHDQAADDRQTRWEMLEWLHSGLAQLDERCRSLLLALYFGTEQPSYSDVAGQLGLAVGSIGPTRARCLQRLRQILGEAQ